MALSKQNKTNTQLDKANEVLKGLAVNIQQMTAKQQLEPWDLTG